MALYTVGTVIDKTKLLIEEAEDSNIITENQLIRAVSDAQKWVAAESGCYQSWGTITLLKDTDDYDPPATTSGVLTLRYDYGGDIGYRNLELVDPQDIPHPPDKRFPYYWFYRGTKVSIYPTLNPLPPNVTVDILTVQIPAALTALTDLLVIPDEFQIVVPYHVAKVVAFKDNQFAKAQAFNTEIERLTKVGTAQYAHQRGITPGGESGTPG